MSVMSNYVPGDVFDIGTTTVVYDATDLSGNVARCQFPVTIHDTGLPVFNDCPEDIIRCTDSGQFTSIVTWTEPTAEDNLNSVEVTTNFEPGVSLPVGETEIVYAATDVAGNSATCIFYAIINDCESPTLSDLPNDISVDSDPGSSSVVVSWSSPTATDNSGTQPTITASIQPGSVFQIGTTEVVYTATDMDGNSEESSFFVTVVDSEVPVLEGCPSDIPSASPVVNWATPSALDNSGSVEITSTHSPGDAFEDGTTEVVYTVTDSSGNSAQCQFSVTVIDTSAPIFLNCSTPIQVSTDLGQPTAVVTWSNPVVIDQSDVTLTQSVQSGTAFDVGVHTVTYYAVNSNGIQSNCTFTITVIDDEIPKIFNCPTDISQVGGVVHWTPPTATDNTDMVTLLSDHSPGSTFPVGVTSVEYTAMDQYNNVNYCIFSVTVEDDGSPVVESCPSTIQLEAAEDSTTATATWTTPTATDDQGVTSTTFSHSSGDDFDIGSTTVVYVFEDSSGNSATCTFAVVVSEPTDNTNPTVTCPDDIVTMASAGTTAIVVTWEEPVAIDNVGIQVLSPTHNPSSLFPVGETSVTYVAIDTSGNLDQCTFIITVEEFIDSNAPTINGCPNDISVETSSGNIPLTISWIEPTAADNAGDVVLTSTHSPGSSFDLGSTTVVYTATDISGNTDTCTFNIDVTEEFVDTDPPVITGCPSDVEATAPLGETSTSVTWTPPTANDNSGTPAVDASHNPGDTFEAVSTEVTYTAVDSAGNHAVCSFSVNVMIETDSVAPTFTSFPSDIEKIVAPGTSSVIVTWNTPVATDNAGSPTVTSQYSPGQSFSEGMTVVVYTATDSSGNTATDMFTITITVDDSPPTITNYPDDIVATVDVGVTSTSVTWEEPTATDGSGAVTQVGPNFEPGSVFSLGTTVVSYTFVDQFGNTATSQFSITVQSEDDSEAPFIYGCSGDISTTLPSGTDSVTVSWTQPTATDNSGYFTSESNHAPGNSFTEGTTSVVYVFTDDSGNQATCSFNVFVTDLISLTCPGDQTAIATTSSSSSVAAVTWTEPTIDESSGFSLSSTHNPGALFSVGTTVVTYTAVDSLNNVVSCSFSVIVSEQDTTPPIIINLPSNIVTSTIPGRDTASVTWDLPSASDNSNSYQLIGNYDPPAEFDVGTTAVTYTATDDAGNTATASFFVTVEDNERPAISDCPSSQSAYVLDSSSTALVHWDEPTATDNAGSVTMVSDIDPGERLSPGQYVVTYTATDQSGNTATCSFTLTISLATYTDPISASTTFDIIRGHDGSFSEIDAATLLPLLEDDIEDAIRQSELSSSVVGVTVNGYSFDNDTNPVVDYTIYFDEGSSVTESDVEAILNTALQNGVLPTGNTVQSGYFYIGSGECADVTCQNGGTCTRNTDGYECQCTSSWTGNLCQTDVDECASSSICNSDLVCKNTFGGYSCECEPGFHLKDSVCVLSKEITGEFAIAEIGDDTAIFTETYQDPTSAEYLDLEAKVIETLTDIFKDLPGFVSIYVFQFTSGSIKVQYVVQFDYESNTTAPNVNTIFNENVANDGMLSDSILDLEPESYQVIEELCVSGYCSNGGECSIDPSTYVSMCLCPDGYTGDRCDDIAKVAGGDEFQVLGIVLGSLVAFIFVFLILVGFCCWLLGARRRQRKGALYDDDDDHRIVRTPPTPRDSPALQPVFYPPPISDNGYDLREESNLGGNLDDVHTRRSLHDGSGFLNPYVATGYFNKGHSVMNQFDDDRFSVEENNPNIPNSHRMY